MLSISVLLVVVILVGKGTNKLDVMCQKIEMFEYQFSVPPLVDIY